VIRWVLKATLCVCMFGTVACNQNDRPQGGDQKGTEEEFAEGGDFSRVNGSGKFDFSYKKTYARAPELVIDVPKEASPSISYSVTERKLDGFTIHVSGLLFDNTEQLAVLMKSIKWRVTGMVPRSAK
jgi:hypothetical protein